jgi:hypothetical protein
MAPYLPLLSRGAGAAEEVVVGLRSPYLDLSLTVRLGIQTAPPEGSANLGYSRHHGDAFSGEQSHTTIG